MTRRRLCRALDCPRHVDPDTLFCNVHWPLLGPRRQAVIANNREAPANAGATTRASVLSGTDAAVAFLARREGKAARLPHAAAVPAQGGDGGAGKGTRAGGTTRFNSRY